MSANRNISCLLMVITVFSFSLGPGQAECSADSIYLPLILNPLTVTIADGARVTVSPAGKFSVQKGQKIPLEITPENNEVIPILLVNGEPVEIIKSGTIYKYELTVVGDTSVYATSAIETKLTAKAKIMDAATISCLASHSADDGTLTFKCSTPYLQSLQIEDVIIVGVTEVTPYGFFRKATHIKFKGSEIIIETSEAELVEAIEEAEIIVNEELNPDNISSFIPLLEGVTLKEQGLMGPLAKSACLSLDSVLFDADGDKSTWYDQIVLNGDACIGTRFKFALGIGWWPPRIKNLVLATKLEETIDLNISAFYALAFGKRIPVAKIVFGVIAVGPLVFVPTLTVHVGIEAGLVGGIQAGVGQYGGLTLGLAYHKGDWNPIADFTVDFDVDPVPTVAASAWARVFAGPEFDFLLYGVAGTYLNLEGYFGITMAPLTDPWLSVYGGVRSGAGIKASIFGWGIRKGFTLFDYRKDLVNVPANKPPTITGLTASRTRLFGGDTSAVTLSASDPEGDALTCSWSTSGGALSAATGCSSVTWTAPGTPGTYTLTVSVTDNWPGHSPATRMISMDVDQNLPPIITQFYPASPTVILGGSSAVTFSASDPEGDSLTCSWSTNGGTLSAATGCSSVTWTAPGTPGVYNIAISVTDNRPGHSPVLGTTTISVVTALGCVQLISPQNPVMLDNGCQDGSNLLIWDFAWSAAACSGATQYQIYVKHPDDANPLIDALTDTTSYRYEGYFAVEDSRLTGWRWKARAMINGFWTEWSAEFGFDVEPLNTDCTPGAPAGLSATDGSVLNKVRLTWAAPATGPLPTAYKIYRYTSNISAAAAEIGETANLSYDDGVGEDTNIYWYWVRAKYNTWLGPFSNGDSGFSGLVPGDPVNLSATDGYDSAVYLTWTAPATGGPVEGYRIWRYQHTVCSICLPPACVNIGLSTDLAYTDNTAYTNTSYCYWVKAYNQFGLSGFSNGDLGYCTEKPVAR